MATKNEKSEKDNVKANRLVFTISKEIGDVEKLLKTYGVDNFDELIIVLKAQGRKDLDSLLNDLMNEDDVSLTKIAIEE